MKNPLKWFLKDKETLKTEFHDEWLKAKKELMFYDIEDNAYDYWLRRINDIERMLVELDKEDTKKSSETRQAWIRVAGELAKTGLTLTAAFAMGIMSMNWEKDHIQEHEAGRAAWRDLLRFK